MRHAPFDTPVQSTGSCLAQTGNVVVVVLVEVVVVTVDEVTVVVMDVTEDGGGGAAHDGNILPFALSESERTHPMPPPDHLPPRAAAQGKTSGHGHRVVKSTFVYSLA
jgi:hypothetical protein